MAILDELFVKLGYDVEQETVDTFNEGVQNTILFLKRAAIAGIAAATGIVLFTKKMAGFQNEQKQIAANLFIPAKLSQAWQDAADDMGISSGQAVSALSKVRKIQEDLATGKPPSQDFLRGLSNIGISLSDLKGLNASEALLKINEGLSKLKGTVKGGTASLLGLREELNFVGNPKLSKAISDNIRNIDTSGLEGLTKQWADFTQAGRDASVAFANEVAPTIGSALDSLSGVINGLRENFGGFLQAIANDEINPLDDFVENVDSVLFDAPRKAFSKFLESSTFQDFGKLINDSLGIGIPQLTPAQATGGSSVSNSSNVTVNNKVQIDISSDNPIAVKNAIKRELESQNQKAIGNQKNRRIN